ncbi:MAG: FCD domain-containing protein [Protaetiibacter sp.]
MTEERPLETLHVQVLDRLGLAIANGELREGESVTIDELESRYGVSRSVIRETLKVLESKGMVASRRRVGVAILPVRNWTLYDPAIIRWRLASDGRQGQLRSLIELRLAIEPEAARLAAERATVDDASALMGVAAQLWAAGRGGRMEEFIELDIEYHRLLLAASGNEMFAHLDSLIGEIISGRAAYGLMPQNHSTDGLQLHVDVATAVQAGNTDLAHDAMHKIIVLAIAELTDVWEHEAESPRS